MLGLSLLIPLMLFFFASVTSLLLMSYLPNKTTPLCISGQSVASLQASVGLGKGRETNANEKLMLPVLLKVVMTSDAEAG